MIKTALFTALLAGAFGTLGCQKKTGETSPSPSVASITLNGSGSTLSKPYQEAAIEQFKKTHSGITINYGGGGSGKGRQDLADMVVEFAGSDSPFKDADAAKAKGGPILYVPILLAPIAVIYNLDGAAKLQLSAPTIAKIFQREITKWNDKAIAADNPGLKLPATEIVVAHRADGSGTTQNFTEYLNGAAQGVWKLKSGSTVEWASDTQAGQGNSGVAQIVKSTKGAIGYADLSDAKASGLKYASIENQAGKYVEATTAGASAAGDGIEVGDNLLFSALNAKGDQAYPLTAQTWVIVYATQPDRAKGEALKAYLTFLVKDGQGLLGDIDYAPLPKGLQDKALEQVDNLKLR
ncbi:MAG TPA: phosphate ABC transporter substrate-binding protein PstS [Polyangia bacterium]|nr:phosphate ABC transporter substrate-binding protein PstS [Polyangia bacterium]